MRQLVCSLLITTALLLPVAAGAALVSPNALKARGYVNDFAEVIEPEWEQRLTTLLTQLDQKTKAQIAVVTLRSLEGEPIEDFANKLFQVWGVGHKDDRGALLLLVIQDRKSRLEVGYGLEPIVPDGFAGSVLREMRPALREKKYGQALYAGTLLLAQRVAQASGVALEGAGRPPAGSATGPASIGVKVFSLLVFLGFFGLVVFFIIMSVKNPRYWQRTSYARSGGYGGFGGYDSGGSSGSFGGAGSGGGFGGFGGGSSGGGGASSDW